MPPSEKIMKRSILGLLSLAILSSTVALAQSADAAAAAPPVTRQGDVKETLHGVTVADPYRWLEDQESTETRAWITQQNDYTHKILDRWPGRDRLEKRLAELKKVERISTPIERSGRLFYRKRAADQEQFVIYTRLGDAGKEEVLLDPEPDESRPLDQRRDHGCVEGREADGLCSSRRRQG